jgi:hypothetical protein
MSAVPTGVVSTPPGSSHTLPRWNDDSFDAQRARARYWLSHQRQRKTINYQLSAYALKHRAERNYGHPTVDRTNEYFGYVSTDALLMAARDLEFLISGNGPDAHLNIAEPTVMPPLRGCLCTGSQPPARICDTCFRERSAKFITDPMLWRRLKRVRLESQQREFARRLDAGEPLSDEENALWHEAPNG